MFSIEKYIILECVRSNNTLLCVCNIVCVYPVKMKENGVTSVCLCEFEQNVSSELRAVSVPCIS